MARNNAGLGSTEFRSTSEPKSGFIRGNTFNTKRIEYSIIDGLAIFEGDIVLGTAEEMESVTEAVVIPGQQFRWPRGEVPYQIQSGFPDQNRVTGAIQHWENRTPIRFILRSSSNATTYPNYVEFADGNGCSSEVGMHVGRQAITLCPNCSMGNAIHEIGHAVGLWHEQSREDRDSYVRIELQNIISGTVHNFDQRITDGDDIGPYDYCSIMHYTSTHFSKNNLPTIVALLPGAGGCMGQRETLSYGDVAAVRQIYDRFFSTTNSGFLVQSYFGIRGNFELVVPRTTGGLASYWRNNDDIQNLPWSQPAVFGQNLGNIDAVSLIQSNFGNPGNLEVIARMGNKLVSFWRDSGPSFTWYGPTDVATGVSGNPVLIQGRFGIRGNFELVVPRTTGGLASYWRNNDDIQNLPWSQPAVFGQNLGNIDAVSLIQSNFGNPGNLEVIARMGNKLVSFWRDSGPSFTWYGPTDVATGVSGNPALIQGRFGIRGNFELVVPRTTGGLASYWRNNDDIQNLPWSQPAVFGQNLGNIDAVSLIQSNFGNPGNLEVIARMGNKLVSFWRDSGPSFTWYGPTDVAIGV